LAQAALSEHLRIVKAAGVITGEIDGPRVCHALDQAVLTALTDFIAAQTPSGGGVCCMPDPSARGDET